MKTILGKPETYHVSDAIKFGDYNVGRNGNLLTLPWYMALLIPDESGLMTVPEIDISSLNAE